MDPIYREFGALTVPKKSKRRGRVELKETPHGTIAVNRYQVDESFVVQIKHGQRKVGPGLDIVKAVRKAGKVVRLLKGDVTVPANVFLDAVDYLDSLPAYIDPVLTIEEVRRR